MTQADLKPMTDQQLYERFVELSIEMGEIYNRSTTRYRRLFKRHGELVDEIRSRRADASLLLPALRHEDPWVRYAAVTPCFEAAPEEALAVLRDLSNLKFHSLGPIAGMALDFREGRYPSPEVVEISERMRRRRESSS